MTKHIRYLVFAVLLASTHCGQVSAQHAITSKLDGIVVPWQEFRDADCNDIALFLSDSSKQLDAKHDGVLVIPVSLSTGSFRPVTYELRHATLRESIKRLSEEAEIQTMCTDDAVYLYPKDFTLTFEPLGCSNDTYRVYSSVLRAEAKRGTRTVGAFVIQSWTASFTLLDEGISNSLVDQDTLNDYRQQKDKSIQLSKDFDVTQQVTLLNMDEVSRIIGTPPEQSKLQQFRMMYPGAGSLTRFSRVGFNASHTQAVVCIERGSTGRAYLLAKVDNIWRIICVLDSYVT